MKALGSGRRRGKRSVFRIKRSSILLSQTKISKSNNIEAIKLASCFPKKRDGGKQKFQGL